MPTFHLTDQSGASYEVEAPDENAAVNALGQVGSGSGATQPPPQQGGFLKTVDNAMRALANGATFGLADRFAAGMGAMTGVGGTGGDYAGNLKSEQAKTDQFSEQHPYISGGLNIVGGAPVPLGAFGAAAKGATLGTKTLLGMGAGAGIGGASGALSSRDWTDPAQTAKDAAIGAGGGMLIGGIMPGAGKAIGAGYNAVANTFRGNAEGMSRAASGHLVDAIRADTVPAVQQELGRLGPDAMLADAGPAFLGKAQGASLNSDEGRTALANALRARNEGTNARISADVNNALGPAEDPQTVTNAIRAHRSTVDEQNYGQALRSGNAVPVDTTSVLANLGPMIGGSVGMENRALTNLRNMLMTERQVPRIDPQTGYQMTDAHANPLFDTVPTPQTNPEILHKIKGELDNVIQYDAPGLGIPAAALSHQQGALKQMRGQLNDALEQQVPGYARANAASSGLARRADAVEAGTQMLGAGKTTPSPDRFSAEFSAMAPGEQIAFAKGGRGTIDRALGTKANDLQALRSELQGEGGWNTAKLATVYGQPAANDLVGSVDRNLKFRDTFNKVVENSQTAQRQAAASAMKPTPSTETPVINPNMSITGLAATLGKKAVGSIYGAVTRSDPTAAYGEVANILSAQGAQRDRHTRALAEALMRRDSNAAMAPAVGDRAALAAALLANGYAQSGPRRRQEQAQ